MCCFGIVSEVSISCQRLIIPYRLPGNLKFIFEMVSEVEAQNKPCAPNGGNEISTSDKKSRGPHAVKKYPPLTRNLMGIMFCFDMLPEWR